ncbi:MAG: cytochrome c family protein [Fimbriimonadaceae bacterium]|nr:cytochrome c family protein [Alphaproteobacteria bacterium]
MLDLYTLNKIIGATLFSILIILGLGIVSDIVFNVAAPEKPGYMVAVETADEGEGHGDATSESSAPEASSEPETSEEVSLGTLLASGDIESGMKQAKKCAACHSFDEGGPNKVGPNLHDIVGREVASVSGFGYSSAMQAFGGTWTYENLYAFVTKPKDLVPETTMGFAGLKKPQQRADLIAYLRSISPNAPALPE